MLYLLQKSSIGVRAATVLWCSAATALSTGCSVPRKIDPGFVAERWSATLSAFNIDPIFLPRQIHLGDIYLAGEPSGDADRDASRWKRRTIYLGRAAVREAVVDDTKTRLRLPSTSVTNPSDDVFEAPPTTTTLRPVAFPGFNISEVRESDFTATFPFNLVRALFGASGSGELVMSVSIPSAEYEEVPALVAWDKFGEFCWKENAPPVCAASNPVLQHLFNNLKLPSDKETLVPKVGIVTSVYYARQINYFYKTGRTLAFGAKASLPLPAPESVPAVPAKTPSTTPAIVAGSTGSTIASTTDTTAPSAEKPAATANSTSTGAVTKISASADPAAAAPAPAPKPTVAANTAVTVPTTGSTAQAANAPSLATTETAALHEHVQVLQKRLDELQKNTEGAAKYGSIRVVSSTNEGTVLSQTFERPVAIGYRALWIFPLGYKPPPSTVLQLGR